MSAPDPQLRIADADREQAMADLALSYTDGRLDHEEYDERLDAVWTARTQADLTVLFNDLPRPQPSNEPTRASRPTARRRRLPLLPLLAVLILLSAVTHQPFWLLVFPLMYVSSHRRGHGSRPSGHADYRRTRRSLG